MITFDGDLEITLGTPKTWTVDLGKTPAGYSKFVYLYANHALKEGTGITCTNCGAIEKPERNYNRAYDIFISSGLDALIAEMPFYEFELSSSVPKKIELSYDGSNSFISDYIFMKVETN